MDEVHLQDNQVTSLSWKQMNRYIRTSSKALYFLWLKWVSLFSHRSLPRPVLIASQGHITVCVCAFEQ